MLHYQFVATTWPAGDPRDDYLSIVFDEDGYEPLELFLSEYGMEIFKLEFDLVLSGEEEYLETNTEVLSIEINPDTTRIIRWLGHPYEFACVANTQEVRHLMDICTEKLHWNRAKQRYQVKLPFCFRTLVFPEGVDYFSIDFGQGYEMLSIFLVLESITFQPILYRAFQEVLDYGSDYQELGLNACSLEIRPDTTKIMDELIKRDRKRCCEIDTEELWSFLHIWEEEWEQHWTVIKRNYRVRSDAEYRRMVREERKEEERKRERKWNLFWQKDSEEEPEQEIKKAKKPELDVDGSDLGVYIEENHASGIRKRSGGNYSACFPKTMTRKQVKNCINEACHNKVLIAGNAYMGRAKNGMKIALFLKENEEIISAFPLF